MNKPAGTVDPMRNVKYDSNAVFVSLVSNSASTLTASYDYCTSRRKEKKTMDDLEIS